MSKSIIPRSEKNVLFKIYHMNFLIMPENRSPSSAKNTNKIRIKLPNPEGFFPFWDVGCAFAGTLSASLFALWISSKYLLLSFTPIFCCSKNLSSCFNVALPFKNSSLPALARFSVCPLVSGILIASMKKGLAPYSYTWGWFEKN